MCKVVTAYRHRQEAAGSPAGNEMLSTIDEAPSTDEIAEFVSRHYGLTAAVTQLTSERDANYAIAAGGERYLLKLAHSAEDPAVVDLQTKAFQHIQQAAPTIALQRLVPALGGAFTTSFVAVDGQQRLAWMLTYLTGIPLSGCEPLSVHAAQLGRVAADIDVALSSFAHSSAARGLLWDIQHALQTRVLLTHTQASGERSLCEQALDRFERHTGPALHSLRTQVIHNDLNPHNVLVAEDDTQKITGVIDFGDMVAAPVVNEIAVAAAYLVGATPAPLGLVPECVSAYHRRNPLDPTEIVLIPSLIAVRQAITIAITNWRATMHPGNRRYILRNQARALEGLRKLTALGESRARELLLKACGSSRP